MLRTLTRQKDVYKRQEYDQEREIRITKVKIETEKGARAMGKPVGTYITTVSYTHLDVYKRQEKGIKL